MELKLLVYFKALTISVYVCMCVRVYVYVCVCIYVYVCMCIYIYMCVYIYIYIYIRVHIYNCLMICELLLTVHNKSSEISCLLIQIYLQEIQLKCVNFPSNLA
jgi:hypothetical protein